MWNAFRKYNIGSFLYGIHITPKLFAVSWIFVMNKSYNNKRVIKMILNGDKIVNERNNFKQIFIIFSTINRDNL